MLHKWLGLLTLLCSLTSPAFGEAETPEKVTSPPQDFLAPLGGLTDAEGASRGLTLKKVAGPSQDFLGPLGGRIDSEGASRGPTPPVVWTYTPGIAAQNLAEARQLPEQAWRPLPSSGMINAGFPGHSLWLSTRYSPAKPGKQVLELVNPQHDRITLYILRDDQLPEILQGGFRQPSSPQSLDQTHNQLFDFNLEPGQNAQLYLHTNSVRPLFVWPRLNDSTEFFRIHLAERLWLGGYIGLFVALCLYSLMAWLITRDDNYADYFVFLFFMCLVHGQMLGLWHELFLSKHPQWMDYCSTLFPCLGLAAFCRFARNYLDLRHQAPHLHRLLSLCMWGSPLLILPAHALGGSELSIPLCDLLSVAFSGAGILAGLRLLQRGYRPARYYLLSQAPLVCGGTLYVGANFGLLPATELSMFGFQIGAALSTLMLTLALAGKVRSLQQEHLQAQSDRLIAEQQIIEVLRESEAQLELRVQERTHQLEEALLLQRQQHDALERNNHCLKTLHEERGAFLQIAAHDLKNPTAAILSYADLLRERWHTWDDDKKLKRLGNIRQMSQLIFDIIRNLLDIDAIESGSYQLRPITLNAADVLNAVCEDYRERCEAKDLRLRLAVSEGTLKLRVDKTALHQIIDNLLSNAIKYSPHGRSIHVSLEQEAGHALIQIRDEGPGLSDEDQSKLFRKFTRLSARPTGGEHSTGLGLSIVKHMVEASGGQVGCISRLGEGATFHVSLPLAA